MASEETEWLRIGYEAVLLISILYDMAKMKEIVPLGTARISIRLLLRMSDDSPDDIFSPRTHSRSPTSKAYSSSSDTPRVCTPPKLSPVLLPYAT